MKLSLSVSFLQFHQEPKNNFTKSTIRFIDPSLRLNRVVHADWQKKTEENSTL